MTWKRNLLIANVLLIAMIAGRVLVRGERLERTLLRTGGKLVQVAAQRPGRTLGVFGCLLGATWITVAGATLWQARRSRVDQTQAAGSPGEGGSSLRDEPSSHATA